MDVKQILFSNLFALHRKEVIQPLVLERLPCYDFTPVMCPAFGSSSPLLATNSYFRVSASVIFMHIKVSLRSTFISTRSYLPGVRSLTSGIAHSHGVTGGVYKTRERIHRSILICDY